MMEEEITETLVLMNSEDGEVINDQEEVVENELLDKSATNLDTSGTEKQRHVRLPLARVKNLIKTDPNCGMVSQDAVFLVTKATELFINYMSRHIAEEVANSKRKTVMKRDVNAVIGSVPKLCFLDGALE